MQQFAHVQLALEALTGPIGSTVGVTLLGDDPEEGFSAVLVNWVVMGDRLEAIVVDDRYYSAHVGEVRRRRVVPWRNVRTLTLPRPSEEPTP